MSTHPNGFLLFCKKTQKKKVIIIKKYQRLKDLREDADKTQEDIAKLLNTTQQQYYRYENGIREIPVRHLIKLAEEYNTSIDYLLSLTDEMRPYKRRNNIYDRMD